MAKEKIKSTKVKKTMAKARHSMWPVGNSHFEVNIDGIRISFQKVSGLRSSHKVVEYRAGDSGLQPNVKMPVSSSPSDIVLSKGVFQGDLTLFNWFYSVFKDDNFRKIVTIKLLDNESHPIFSWTLINAFPKEIVFGELDAVNATYSVEELVLTCDELRFQTP